ncbi:MAG TPA: histidinol-phosphate aminotransferase family protein [Candidatus Jeotgalicoccus stercoravium]|nr:histidinol-phosphate aminotransferase family protein [Candidatus Jeotgalicoccus stercoravium]
MISMDRNTSPQSPLSSKEILAVIEKVNIEEYPEKELDIFKERYAKRNGFKVSQIEVANGSDEWLQKIIMTLGKNGVMSFKPDFFMYQQYTNQVAYRFYSVPSRDDFSFDFDRAVEAIKDKKPSVFFVSNPQNPTGQLLPSHGIKQLSEAMKSVGGYLVIDEAYGEYALERELPKGDHIIIVRTMSKIYGLAGLRVGIAIAEGETFQRINRINHPYPVNSLSLALASEVLKDENRLEQWIAYQKDLQKELVDSFEAVRRHVRIKPSHTNFVFIYGEKARDLYDFLLKEGYRGRIYDDANLKEVARFSIIDKNQYPQLKTLIKEWGEKHDSL